ncbi:MAG: NusG domain II-containing protein [Firmicutes bacterium]|nr:NusG domain II-containing protein [Bacillota bacterium]
MRKHEIIIILLIITTCIATIGITKLVMEDDSVSKTAVIYRDGRIIKTVSLDDTKFKKVIDIKIGHDKVTLKIADGGVSIIHSTCPDQICVHDGFIDKSGEMLVCLPNKILVEIKESTGED